MCSSPLLRNLQFCFSSKLLFVSLSAIAFASNAPAQCGSSDIGGRVFSDYNANGVMDTLEPSVSGVTVTLFDATGAAVQTVNTATDGSYVFPGAGSGAAYRIEFSNIPGYAYPGPAVGNADTTVQFVNQSSCDRDLAISNPAKFCNSDPLMALPCYVPGDPLAGGTSGDMDALVGFNYSDEGEGQPHLLFAYNRDIGTTWGTAYHRETQSVLAGAFMKRHTGFGPNGTGAIYKSDISDPMNPAVSLFVDLNSYPGVDTGADLHGTLPADILDPVSGYPLPSLDENAFDAVGKIGLGDIDLSEDEQTLWVVNLNQRTLHKLEVGTDLTAPSTQKSFPIPGAACTDSTESRPFGLKVHKGKVYVGGVCSGENSSMNELPPELKAYVYEFDPTTEMFTLVFQLDLDFAREYALAPTIARIGADEAWQPWAKDSADIFPSPWPNLTFVVYPQAMLSDIEFTSDDRMILGFSDRTGNQFGRGNYYPAPEGVNNPGNLLFTAPTAGDLMLADKVGPNLWQVSNPTNEFFFEDDFFFVNRNEFSHQEVTQGGIALLPLSGEVKSTVFDPIRVSNNVESSGLRAFAHVDRTLIGASGLPGEVTSELEVVPPNLMFGKASGLGDLEFICERAPLQVGNRVWFDTNQNGIQDAGEAGIAGVTVNLYDSNNQVVDSQLTDAEGQFLFSVTPGGSYTIRLDNPSDYATGGTLEGYELTASGAGSNSAIDSNGSIPVSGTYAEFTFTAGLAAQNDHTFDFGYFQTPPPVDCAGTPGGTAVVDECGVCGGTGKDSCGLCPNQPDFGTESCFACSEADYTQDQTTLDQGVKLMEDLVNQLLRRIRRLDPSPQTAKWANKMSSRANDNQILAWVNIWQVPSIQTNCENPSPICVTSNSNAEPLQIYREGNRKVHKIFRKVLRRLRRLTGNKKAGKAKQKKEIKIYNNNVALADTIPEVTTVCTQ